MASEMEEQPKVISSLLGRRSEINEAVCSVLPHRPAGIVIVARGSSDHAAVYGRYVLQVASRRPVALAAPSLHMLYHASIDCTGYLCIGISQSGQTPEIVEVLEEFGRAGGRTLAITNGSQSPLAEVANRVIDLRAGPERAVPATKTFTAQLTALALVAEAIGEVPWTGTELERVPGQVAEVLEHRSDAERCATRLRGARGAIVAGRGHLFAVALEIALKLREACGLLAEGYSSGDLRHGPLAAVHRGLPAVVLSAAGPAEADALELARALRELGALLLTAADRRDADLPVPGGLPDALAAIPLAVRGQQLAHALALSLDRDPDAPPGLSKVTAT